MPSIAIGDNLICERDTLLSNPGEVALNISGARIRGRACFGEGLSVQGSVHMVGITTDRSLDLGGGHFSNPDGIAINADGAKINASIHLSKGFKAEGEVSFRAARVTRSFNAVGGSIDRTDRALDLRLAIFGRNISLRQPNPRYYPEEEQYPKTHINGVVDLTGANCDTFDDNALEATPNKFSLRLDRFRYESINVEYNIALREAWLLSYIRGQSGKRSYNQTLVVNFTRYPFEQLAKVLRVMGHEEDARHISILKLKKLREVEWIKARRRLLAALQGKHGFLKSLRGIISFPVSIVRYVMSLILEGTLGFGYRQYFVIVWSLFFIGVGGLWFDHAFKQGAIVPNHPVVLHSKKWRDCVDKNDKSPVVRKKSLVTCYLEKVPEYQGFSPFVYSFDVFLPLFDLQQEKHWIPNPKPKKEEQQWTVSSVLNEPTTIVVEGSRIYMWIHTGIGYLLSALAVASFTGIVQKD